MQIENLSIDGVEVIKDEKTPLGCIRIYWSYSDFNGEEIKKITDLIISQTVKRSSDDGEPFVLIDDEFGEDYINRDMLKQILMSLADKTIIGYN